MDGGAVGTEKGSELYGLLWLRGPVEWDTIKKVHHLSCAAASSYPAHLLSRWISAVAASLSTELGMMLFTRLPWDRPLQHHAYTVAWEPKVDCIDSGFIANLEH